MNSDAQFSWNYVLGIAKTHKKKLLVANLVAILAVVASVPIPLLIPLLVDEVLLNQPGKIVAWVGLFTPEHWHTLPLYIFPDKPNTSANNAYERRRASKS